MRVLIAESDLTLASSLVNTLRGYGWAVDQVATGIEAEAAVRTYEFDLLILDLALRGPPGIEVMRRARASNAQTRVLALTTSEDVHTRVHSLDEGVDDILLKPFAVEELAARARALGRRTDRGSLSVITYGTLVFDRVDGVAYLGDQLLALSRRELRILDVLMRRPGVPVSKERFVDLLCQWDEELSPNTIEVYVHRLRKKIENDAFTIATRRGIGYYLASSTRVRHDRARASRAPAAKQVAKSEVCDCRST